MSGSTAQAPEELTVENAAAEPTPSRFSKYSVSVSTYRNSSPLHRFAFRTWVGGMTIEDDGERGGGPGGMLEQILAHNESFADNGLHQTFIYADSANRPLATGSIIQDDRGLSALHQIEGHGFFCLMNVRKCSRGLGLGRIVSDHLDSYVQGFATAARRSLRMNLLTRNEKAVQLCARLGFEYERTISLESGDEELYTKVYLPV